MNQPTFSVIIPAHNEEKYIGKCLRAILSAAKYVQPDTVEIIVVANSLINLFSLFTPTNEIICR